MKGVFHPSILDDDADANEFRKQLRAVVNASEEDRSNRIKSGTGSIELEAGTIQKVSVRLEYQEGSLEDCQYFKLGYKLFYLRAKLTAQKRYLKKNYKWWREHTKQLLHETFWNDVELKLMNKNKKKKNRRPLEPVNFN